MTIALTGTTTERKTSSSSTKLRASTKAMTHGQYVLTMSM